MVRAARQLKHHLNAAFRQIFKHVDSVAGKIVCKMCCLWIFSRHYSYTVYILEGWGGGAGAGVPKRKNMTVAR